MIPKPFLDNRIMTCLKCHGYIGHFTPKNIGEIIVCTKCGTKFQITSDIKEWKDLKVGRVGVSFNIAISAHVDNPLDLMNLKRLQ